MKTHHSSYNIANAQAVYMLSVLAYLFMVFRRRALEGGRNIIVVIIGSTKANTYKGHMCIHYDDDNDDK